MAFDIAISGDTEDAYTDGTNDLATVDGNRRLEQHVYLNVGQEIQRLLSGKLTGDDIARIESAIETGLENAEDIEDTLSVTVDEYDKEKQKLLVSVQAQSGTTQLNINV